MTDHIKEISSLFVLFGKLLDNFEGKIFYSLVLVGLYLKWKPTVRIPMRFKHMPLE